MSKKAFDKIAEGLTEAIAIARNDAAPARMHVPAEIDVRAVRVKTHELTPTLLVRINAHVNSRDILHALQQGGWEIVGQKGSHVQLKHPTKPGRVTVPHPKRDMPIGTVRSIEGQAGLQLVRM